MSGYLESIILSHEKNHIRLLSPAKINLHLRVLDKRTDRYHNLVNIMQTIGFFDEILIELAEAGINIHCDNPSIPADRENIAWRVAENFLKAIGNQNGISIRLKKRIPAGGGLGGGSSNAGTVLLGLNRLFGNIMETPELIKFAIDAGSDVPFFLFGGISLCKGRGEVVEPWEPLDEFLVVLINPGITISTKHIYESYVQHKKPLTSGMESVNMIECKQVAYARGPVHILRNDLAGTVENMYPELKEIRTSLTLAGCEGAMLTGSGSSVFGLCKSREQAERARSILRDKYNDRRYLIKVASSRIQQGGEHHVSDHGCQNCYEY